MMARMLWACAFAVLAAVGPASADPLARSHYMNTYYCAGVAAAYGERVAGESSHARSVAATLAKRAASFGQRYGFQASEGKRAEAKGRSTIAGMMPQGGAWQTGGSVPDNAFRQYQHCVTLAEL